MENNKELVSVITITRNRARIIGRAISSVLNQTYRNFEYIIVDGASEDNTYEVVTSFQDPRINYIRLGSNIFGPEIIDIAVNNCSGRYITFLDDDDEYLPPKIEKQVEHMSRLPEEFGFIYCWMDYYDDQTNKLVMKWHPKNKGNVFLNQIEKQSIGGTPTLFLRKEAYSKIGGFNKKLRAVADYEFSTRLSKYYLTDYVPEVLVKVHINHGYQRLTTEPMDMIRIEKLIEFHEYYLEEFKDSFEKYPFLQLDHLNSLARLYYSSKKIEKGKSILLKIMKIKPFAKKTYTTIVRCMFMYTRLVLTK